MTDTSELIRRLEEATEGSRPLDGEIGNALAKPRCNVDGGSDWYIDGKLARRYGGNWPHYTTSIDAALTLVPEAMGWSIGGSTDAEGPMFGASVDVPRDLPALSSCCPTPAIALTIAALKARARIPERSE